MLGLVSAVSWPCLSNPPQLDPGAEGGIWARGTLADDSMFDVIFSMALL